jgi:hypothetical protein
MRLQEPDPGGSMHTTCVELGLGETEHDDTKTATDNSEQEMLTRGAFHVAVPITDGNTP